VLFHKLPVLFTIATCPSSPWTPACRSASRGDKRAQEGRSKCSSGFRSSALSPRFSWFPPRCPPKELGAPSAPPSPGVSRLRRTLSEAHARRINTAVSISTRPPRSRVADSDPCVNGSRDRKASPTRHIEGSRIRRCACGLGCDRPVRATPVSVWTAAGRFGFFARASAGSTNIVAMTAAAMTPTKLRMITFSCPLLSRSPPGPLASGSHEILGHL
jgi:hypothetical protein